MKQRFLTYRLYTHIPFKAYLALLALAFSLVHSCVAQVTEAFAPSKFDPTTAVLDCTTLYNNKLQDGCK